MRSLIKQTRAAFSLLNPEEVRHRAERPINVGLVAASPEAYAEMETFLLPVGMQPEVRVQMAGRVHRASDPDVPTTVDLVLYHEQVPGDPGTCTFHRGDPDATVAEVLQQNDEFSLPLARQFPAFRKRAIGGIIHAVARENALFAIATSLPNVIPNLIELPWIFGEFASDTAFLTANQVRMAFLIAAACGKDPGFADQKAEIVPIVAGAFGWRALARELVSHIPLGGGLIPKGAIAYAGTYAVGKGLEYFHQMDRPFSKSQRKAAFRQSLDRGREVVESLNHQPQQHHQPQQQEGA